MGGLFGVSDDFKEARQSLERRFIKNELSTFWFQASCDSMAPTIFKNDIVLVDRSIESYSGRVCVVNYNGQQICKRVIKDYSSLVLRSDNPKIKDIKVNDAELVQVFGVVISRHSEIF